VNPADYRIQEFRTEHQKYGMKITHIPTGVTIEGNCGWVDKIDETRAILLARLEESVKDAPVLPPPVVVPTRSEIVEQCAQVVDKYLTSNADETSLARALAKAIRKIK
jgi:hypothetical protein